MPMIRPKWARPMIRQNFVRQDMFTGHHDGGVAPDPLFSSVVFLSHFEHLTVPVDKSDQAATITTTAGCSHDAAVSKWGFGSWRNDGTSGEDLSTPSAAALDLGSADFTIEGHFNFRAPKTGNAVQTIISMWGDGSENGWILDWEWPFSTNGRMRWWVSTTGSDFFNRMNTGSFTPVINTWYHIAAERVSGTTTLYVDGIAQVANADAAAYHLSTSDLEIMGRAGLVGNSMDGNAQDVRISTVSRYGANFTPPAVRFADE